MTNKTAEPTATRAIRDVPDSDWRRFAGLARLGGITQAELFGRMVDAASVNHRHIAAGAPPKRPNTRT